MNNNFDPCHTATLSELLERIAGEGYFVALTGPHDEGATPYQCALHKNNDKVAGAQGDSWFHAVAGAYLKVRG